MARAALVAHAERLFAERGLEGVSLRDVSKAAGQANHSAAQYHFGDRRGLVAAVYEARMIHISERRSRRLDALVAEGRADDLSGLVEAFVAPLVEVVAEAGGWYGRFLARTRWDNLALVVLADLPLAESVRRAERQIARALADLPQPIRRNRVDQLVTVVVGTIAGWELAHERGDRHLGADALIADLVSTCVAMLTAPLAHRTGVNR
jgi:AcrR family transcriptional regulator